MILVLELLILVGLVLSENNTCTSLHEKECPCTVSSLWLDIVIAIDTSRGMTNEGLAQVTANIATVLGPVTIAQGQGQHSRVSIITYGATATIVFNFTDFNSTDEMLNEMFKIECGIDEKANLWDALVKAQAVLDGHEYGDRRNVKTVVIVYASENKDEDETDAKQIAEQLKIGGTSIIVIGFDQKGKLDALKSLEKLATPGYFLVNIAENLAGKIQRDLCLINCFCPRQWVRYEKTYENGRVMYAECLRVARIVANWGAAQKSCQRMTPGDGHLVNLFNSAKHDFVARLYRQSFKYENGYHIGLSYHNEEGVSPGYYWEQAQGRKCGLPGDTNFEKWMPGYPNEEKGNYVFATSPKTDPSEFFWQNEGRTVAKRYVCQKLTCDTDNYCSIEDVVKFSSSFENGEDTA